MLANAFDGRTWPIEPSDIVAAEQELGLTFPKSMADFYLVQNGGLPERCYFLQENGVCVWLDAMIPIEPVGEAIDTGMKATFRRLTGEGLLPTTNIPFGRDPGGNFFLLDPEDERVWCMPMDEWRREDSGEANWARSGRTLTHGFGAFMDALSDEEI